jgi:hypothetical protein
VIHDLLYLHHLRDFLEKKLPEKTVELDLISVYVMMIIYLTAPIIINS